MDGCSALPDDGKPDIAGYNKEIEQLGYPKWFNAPWLYIECYLYRYHMYSTPRENILD